MPSDPARSPRPIVTSLCAATSPPPRRPAHPSVDWKPCPDDHAKTSNDSRLVNKATSQWYDRTMCRCNLYSSKRLAHRWRPAHAYRHHSELNWSRPSNAYKLFEDTRILHFGDLGHYKNHACKETLVDAGPIFKWIADSTCFASIAARSTCEPFMTPDSATM